MTPARVVLFLGLAGLLGAGLAACERQAPPPPEAVARAPASPAALAFSRAVAAFNAVSLPGAAELFSEDHELALPISGRFPVKGRDGLLALLGGVQLAFPDGQLTLRRVLESGTSWAAELSFRGTHQAEFLGVPATGKRVECHFALLGEAASGRLTHSLVVGNALSVLKQLRGDIDKLPPGPQIPERPEVRVGPGPAAQVEAVRAFFAAFESGDLPALTGLVAEDVEVLALGDGKLLKGLPALREALLQEREAFEGEIRVEHAISAGEFTLAMVEVDGKIIRDLGPLRASGKPFWEQGLDVFHHQGGKIKGWNNYRNLLDLLTQLGLHPPSPPAPAGR